MPVKQSSSRVSTIAGRLLKITAEDIYNLSYPKEMKKLARDIRALAGSIVSQDETKGQKRKS